MKGNEQIVVEYRFAYPQRTVWRALTEPDLLAGWLMPNDIAPVVGHKFNFRAQPMGDWDGIVYCEVLEVIPEQRLVYSWEGGSGKNEGYGHRLETTVTWTLEPGEDGGTVLKLVHHGFQAGDYAYQVMGQGWNRMGAGITRVLDALQQPA